MKQPVTEQLKPRESERHKQKEIQMVILAVLLAGVSVQSVRGTMGNVAPQINFCMLAGIVCIACMAVSLIRKPMLLFGKCWLLPWLAVLVYYRPAEWWRGFQWWMNQILSGWNQTYDRGAVLFQTESSIRDQMAISLILVFLCVELSWKLAEKHRSFFCAVFCFALLLLLVICGKEDLRISMWLVFVPLVYMLSDGSGQITVRACLWQAGIFLAVFLLGAAVPQQEMHSVTRIRTQVKEGVHELRYGKQSLPMGDLNQAYRLRESTEEMMQIKTGQEKTLYLRRFTGGKYDSASGKWNPLSEADYGNEYSGMFRWLKQQGFHPLRQVAEYYNLGEEEQIPEENQLEFHITGAEREYLYLPFSMEMAERGIATEEKDSGMRSRGLAGMRDYKLQERSENSPAELIMAQNWVSSPQNEEQKKYLEAESVYRHFVYEQEMDVDKELQEKIQKLFWDGYETEQEGIYSALVRIRSVLKNPAMYAEEAGIDEETSDLLSWFLTGDHKGNDMFYATAAVLAFRMHGIPARYAEGYYVSDSVIQAEGGNVSVTGQDAHAWVEVYFDGIGWLPLDVTPGYYYESAQLQQMVSEPDTVRKTAALENDQQEKNLPAEGTNQQKDSIPEKMIKGIRNLLLGAGALLILVVTGGIVVLEIVRAFWILSLKRSYHHADMEERVCIMQKLLYRILAMRGITAKLGWQTEETDLEIAEKIESMEPGTYKKACRLMEKSIFGKIPLEVYEERMLQSVLGKAGQAQKKDSVRVKLRLRFGIMK